MRILHVVEAALAGVARHVLDLSEGLLARGHDVHLVYSPRRADRFFREWMARLDGLSTRPLDLRRGPHPSDLAGFLYLRREVRARGPFDIIHGHSSKGGALARLVALAEGGPAIYTPNAIRSMDPTASAITRALVGWSERALARVDGLTIAVSPIEAQHMAQIGLPRQRLRTVPNGIDPVELPSREAARRSLGLPQEAEVVGFVGRLAPQKAPEVLLYAFEAVARARPQALLAVIGDGPLLRPLQGACEVLGLQDRIRWLGPRNGQQAMPAFDLFALPSRYEGLPHVLLEACLAGLPIVATDMASGGLVVEPNVNGLIVPLDDPDALGVALVRLLRDKAERDAFGRAARIRAARFGHERMVADTEAIYREAISTSRHAGARRSDAPAIRRPGADVEALHASSQDSEPSRAR